MSIQSITLQDTFDVWRQKNNTTAADLGDVSTLSALITTGTNAVQGINEVQADVGDVSTLQTSATNVVQGINELKNGSITFGGTKSFSGAVVAQGNATVQGVMTVQGTSNLGTVGTGTWQATAVSPTYGGTGVNNGSRTITVGAQSITLNSNASTASNVTLPAAGTQIGRAHV